MKRPIPLGELVILECTGDDDALLEGGGIVFRKDDAEYWQRWDSPTTKNYLVWTGKVPRDVLKHYPEVTREELMDQLELTSDELRSMSRSRNVRDRIQLMRGVRELCGDSTTFPKQEDLSTYELVDRWGVILGWDADTFPRVDEDDYFILPIRGFYAAGQVDGRYLGAYEDFEGALASISDHSIGVGNVSNSFYLEDDDAELERLEFDRHKWAPEKVDRIRGVLSAALWRNRMRPWVREAKKKGAKLPLPKRRGLRRGKVSKSRTR
jgi:hypothetical protein